MAPQAAEDVGPRITAHGVGGIAADNILDALAINERDEQSSGHFLFGRDGQIDRQPGAAGERDG